MAAQVIIIMGSKGDLAHAQAVAKTLKTLDISYAMRVCSAHKATRRLMEMLQGYESADPLVYITIRFGGMDILSSLRLPSGMASPTILEPEGAALLAAKMLAFADNTLWQRLENYKQRLSAELAQADEEVQQL